MERILAHHIVVDGYDYGMAVATVHCSGGLWHVDVEPFTREIHSTTFHSGTVIITTKPGEVPAVVRK